MIKKYSQLKFAASWGKGSGRYRLEMNPNKEQILKKIALHSWKKSGSFLVSDIGVIWVTSVFEEPDKGKDRYKIEVYFADSQNKGEVVARWLTFDFDGPDKVANTIASNLKISKEDIVFNKIDFIWQPWNVEALEKELNLISERGKI